MAREAGQGKVEHSNDFGQNEEEARQLLFHTCLVKMLNASFLCEAYALYLFIKQTSALLFD